MTRVVRVKEPTLRRNSILDTAQRLVYTKGYEQMTIQDILDDLQISKGAFYHYYSSKQELLEALTERMIDEVEHILIPIVQNPELPALLKLQRYFDTAARWKATKKAFLLSLIRTWYTDNNAIVRQKFTTNGKQRILPHLTSIIKQGVEEGVLAPPFPDRVGEVVFSVFAGLSDTLADILVFQEPKPGTKQEVENLISLYNDVLERILAAPRGSIHIVDLETMSEWLVNP